MDCIWKLAVLQQRDDRLAKASRRPIVDIECHPIIIKMLSEFEVAKPSRKFSQLHLEYYEMTFMHIKSSLIVEAYR